MVGAVISSIRAIVGSIGAVVGSMGVVVGLMGAVVGLMVEVMGQCLPDEALLKRGSQVLAAAGMRWAGNMMIWRRSLAFVAAARSGEGEAHCESRRTRQGRGTWPPMAGGIIT